MDQHPDTNGTFFDSSKYEYIVSRIRAPDDNDTTTNYEPSKESQEIMETEQNEKPRPKQDLRGRFNKRMFREVKRTQQRKKTDELMAMVKAFVKKEDDDFIQTICFLAQRYCHTTPGKRPLIPVFKQIAKDQEKYTQPNSMSLFEALALKQTLDQSLRAYHRMRLFCQEKLVMPIRDKISDFAKSLTPVAHPFMDGAKYNLKDCLTMTIKDILDVLKIKSDDVPVTVTFIGAIGEDGSGCHGQRQGDETSWQYPITVLKFLSC